MKIFEVFKNYQFQICISSKIWRIVILTETGDFDSNWSEMEVGDKCDEDPNDHGYDCYDVASMTWKLNMKVKS